METLEISKYVHIFVSVFQTLAPYYQSRISWKEYSIDLVRIFSHICASIFQTLAPQMETLEISKFWKPCFFGENLASLLVLDPNQSENSQYNPTPIDLRLLCWYIRPCIFQPCSSNRSIQSFLQLILGEYIHIFVSVYSRRLFLQLISPLLNQIIFYSV